MLARTGISIAVLALAALTGCHEMTARQKLWLVDGERAFTQKRYAIAADELNRFLAEVPEGPETDRALYVRGMANAKLGRRQQAYADIERAVQTCRDPDILWRALAVLGVMRFEDSDWAAAARSLERATDRMPARPPKDWLLFRQGQAYERSGQWSAAREAYRRVLTYFPRGKYAAVAQRRLQLNADHFSVQAGVFAGREGAEQVAAQLAGADLPAFVRRESRAGNPVHVVLVGRHATYEPAVQLLRRVKGYVPDAVLWP